MNKYYDLLQRMVAQHSYLDEAGRESLYARAIDLIENSLKDKYDSRIIAAELDQLKQAIEQVESAYSQAPSDIPPRQFEPAPAPPEPLESRTPAADPAPAVRPAMDPRLEFVDVDPGADMPEDLEDPSFREDEEKASGLPGLPLLLAAFGIVLVTGVYVFSGSKSNYAVTTKVSAQRDTRTDQDEGIASRESLGATQWAFAGERTQAMWRLDTRSPKSVDYVLSRQVLSAQAQFPAAGLQFRVILGELRDAAVKAAYFLEVRHESLSLSGDASVVLKMFMPRIKLKGQAASIELNGVVIRSGSNGFLANLATNAKEHEVNRVLLKQAERLEFPLMLDDGATKVLELDLLPETLEKMSGAR